MLKTAKHMYVVLTLDLSAEFLPERLLADHYIIHLEIFPNVFEW